MWLPLTCPLLGTWPTTQAGGLTGNQMSDPFVRRPTLNTLSHTIQGHFCIFYIIDASQISIVYFDEQKCFNVSSLLVFPFMASIFHVPFKKYLALSASLGALMGLALKSPGENGDGILD